MILLGDYSVHVLFSYLVIVPSIEINLIVVGEALT